MLTHLLIVLPCHSLEDFPTHYSGEDAKNLLSHWTSLWHPALIATVDKMPEWQSADHGEPSWNQLDWDQDLEEHPFSTKPITAETSSHEKTADKRSPFPLVLIPRVSDPIVHTDLLMLADQDGLLISDENSRDDILNRVSSKVEEVKDLKAKISPDLEKDFFALGYAFLQVQLMTRQLRYSSNLDENEFEQAVIAAAKATVGTIDDAQQHEHAADLLTACFDLLLEEKNAYYPVEPQLCDVVLTANTTLGKSLTKELDQLSHATNLLMTGSTARALRAKNTTTVDHIKLLINKQDTLQEPATSEADIDSNTAFCQPSITLIGGLENELPDWLLSSEAVLNQLKIGIQSSQDVFGHRPRVFMRRTFGTSPALPGILSQLGFIGAVHATLGKGEFPRSANGVIRWTGLDQESILAIGDVPINATDSGAFLGLGVRLGEMIDSAHMASAVFVRWPSKSCESFEDLKRISLYTPLFGSFVGFNDFFESVYDPGYGETFASDEYKSTYLSQAIKSQQPNPISRFTKFHQRAAKIESCRRLVCYALTILDANAADDSNSLVADAREFIANALKFQTEAESMTTGDEEFDESCLDELVEQSRNLYRRSLNQAHDASQTPVNSFELVNLHSSKQTIPFRFDATSQTPLGSIKTGTDQTNVPIRLAIQSAQDCHWIVEVPAVGGLHVNPKSVERKNQFASSPPVIDGNRLQNEHLIATLDESTGGIRSVNFHNARLNLFTQQLAMRIPAETQSTATKVSAHYSTMKADSIQVDTQSPITGSLRSTGKLFDGETAVCKFVQTVSIARAIPRLSFEIELTPLVDFRLNPNHYICSRLAWKDESAKIVANSIDGVQPVTRDWFHATRFVTVGDDSTFSMLTGGLPFHRRSNRRMLDSVLMTAGETHCHFKFAIDVNQRFAMSAAEGRLIAPIVLANKGQENSPAAPNDSSNKSKWLLHFDCKNVLATNIEPLFQGEQFNGIQLRLRETEGRKARLKIRCRRPVVAADQVKLDGSLQESLDVGDQGVIPIELESFAHTQINLYFKA